MAAAYWELLRDPQWQKLRLEVMQREDFACELCGDNSSTLNVHHSYYEKGKKPWEYPPESLHCLCEACHEKTHKLRTAINRQIGRLTLEQLQELLGFAYGLEFLSGSSAKHDADTDAILGGMIRAFAFDADELGRHVEYVRICEDPIDAELISATIHDVRFLHPDSDYREWADRKHKESKQAAV